MTDSTVSNLWVVNVDGGRHRPLVSGTAAASSPRWSADGERIAYVQATDSGTGIYVRWTDTGQTALLANLQQGPADLAWSPDGQWLAFVMPVPAKPEPIAWHCRKTVAPRCQSGQHTRLVRALPE